MKPMSVSSRVILGIGACILALISGGARSAVQDTCGPFTDVTPAFCPHVLELYYLAPVSLRDSEFIRWPLTHRPLGGL